MFGWRCPLRGWLLRFHVKSGFLSLGTTDILGQKIIWGYPVHCRMFRNIHGLYLLNASSISLAKRNVSRHCQMSHAGKITDQLKQCWLTYCLLEEVFPGVQALSLQLEFLISMFYL